MQRATLSDEPLPVLYHNDTIGCYPLQPRSRCSQRVRALPRARRRWYNPPRPGRAVAPAAGRRGVNGVHDLGGMHGFGSAPRGADEPVFHAPWEGHVLAMQRALSAHGLIVIDEHRHAIERMAPVDYLTSSYYQRWLASLERLSVEKGLLAREE